MWKQTSAWLPGGWRLRVVAICMPAVIAVAFFLLRTNGIRAQATENNSGTRSVAAGGDLQKALDEAKPGETITLEAGAVFTGNFILRRKAGDGVITLTSSAS